MMTKTQWLLVSAFVGLAGCATIDQIGGNASMQTFTPAYGRAFFLKKTPFGSRVLVCDVRAASGDVVCYDAEPGTPLGQ